MSNSLIVLVLLLALLCMACIQAYPLSEPVLLVYPEPLEQSYDATLDDAFGSSRIASDLDFPGMAKRTSLKRLAKLGARGFGRK